MNKRTLKFYRIDSYTSWYVVKAFNKTDATRDGRQEFGRSLKSVTDAKKEDVEFFEEVRGPIEEAA
jgi:hypothetical protein